MKQGNGVYVIDFDIFLAAATREDAERLARKFIAETGITNIEVM